MVSRQYCLLLLLVAPCSRLKLERRKNTEKSLPSLIAKIPLYRKNAFTIVVVVVILLLPNTMPNIPLSLRIVREGNTVNLKAYIFITVVHTSVFFFT